MPRRSLALTLLIMLTLIGVTHIISFKTAGAEEFVWERFPPIPVQMMEQAYAAVGDDIYLIGGFKDQSGDATGRVEVFNVKTNSWRSGTPRSASLHHAAAVNYKGKIYVFGGYRRDGTATDTVYIYDPEVGRWSEGRRMLRSKAAFTAQLVGDLIYTVGGVETYIEGGRVNRRVLSANEAYDPASDRWLTKQPMPTAREHHAAAAVDGKLYIVGGRYLTLESIMNVNEMYDPEADSWTVKAPMPTKRGGIAGAALNGKVYILGGEAPSKVFSEVEEYDPASDTWRQVKPIPTPRHGMAVVSAGDKIFTLGGGEKPGLYFSDVNEALTPFSTITTVVTRTTTIVTTRTTTFTTVINQTLTKTSTTTQTSTIITTVKETSTVTATSTSNRISTQTVTITASIERGPTVLETILPAAPVGILLALLIVGFWRLRGRGRASS